MYVHCMCIIFSVDGRTPDKQSVATANTDRQG